MICYEYELPPELVAQAEAHNRQRLEWEKRTAHLRGGSHNPNAERLGKASWEAGLEGNLGEMAASMHHGVWPEWSDGPDEGWDFTAPSGERFNVKSAPWRYRFTGRLLVERHLRPSERYLLAFVDHPRGVVRLVGSAPHDRLFGPHAPAKVGGPGLSPTTHWLFQQQLDALPPPSAWGHLIASGCVPIRCGGKTMWRTPGGFVTNERAAGVLAALEEATT